MVTLDPNSPNITATERKMLLAIAERIRQIAMKRSERLTKKLMLSSRPLTARGQYAKCYERT